MFEKNKRFVVELKMRCICVRCVSSVGGLALARMLSRFKYRLGLGLGLVQVE